MPFNFQRVLVVFGRFGGLGCFCYFLVVFSWFVVRPPWGIPYHFPVVSIKSPTVPPRYPLPFPLISSRFWWLLVVLVFGFHQILVDFNSVGGFGSFCVFS